MIELLPFHAPKLSAVAINALNGDDFASRLERCIALARSDRVKRIELRPNEEK